MSLSIHAATLRPAASQPTNLVGSKRQASDDSARVDEAKELKRVFSQFVGESFYGMMLKSMRRTVGEPAYFHGGQAEEMFRSRLDQQIAEDLAASPHNSLADSLFENQFPSHAATLRGAGQAESDAGAALDSLDSLRRR